MSADTIHTIRPVNLTPHPVNLHLADGQVVTIDPALPDPVPGTVHIVARVVAAQAPERDDLVWPDDLIRDDQGRVVGCRALGAAARPAAALTDQEITLLTAGGGEQEPEA